MIKPIKKYKHLTNSFNNMLFIHRWTLIFPLIIFFLMSKDKELNIFEPR